MVLLGLELIGLLAMLRGYLKWSGRSRRWFRTATLGERVIMTTVFGGGPLVEVVAGLTLALQPPLVVAIHFGRYSIGYALIGATWAMLAFGAYLFTARPKWAIPRWMVDAERAPHHPT